MEDVGTIHGRSHRSSRLALRPLIHRMTWAGALTLFLSACQNTMRVDSEKLLGFSAEPALQMAQRNMNASPLNKTICDPWNEGEPGLAENGLRAKLAYRGLQQTTWSKSTDYLEKGQMSGKNLFFNDLFVPTRRFEKGFATQTSQVVTDDMGQRLIEYFGLQFESEIRLNSGDAEGAYQLALLSDDGATLTLHAGAQKEEHLANEGVHASRLACATQSVHLQRGESLPISLSYFQGPRYHISLILLWRPVSGVQLPAEPLCGREGNNVFFDPDRDSEIQPAYHDLLARGWKPVPAANFYLPGQQNFNPCVSGEPLELSSFKLLEVSSYQADLTWRTSRPATSQALVRDLTNGGERLTDSDQGLRTQHALTVTGLDSGVLYEIQAVSVAEDGSKAFGASVRFTTP